MRNRINIIVVIITEPQVSEFIRRSGSSYFPLHAMFYAGVQLIIELIIFRLQLMIHLFLVEFDEFSSLTCQLNACTIDRKSASSDKMGIV